MKGLHGFLHESMPASLGPLVSQRWLSICAGTCRMAREAAKRGESESYEVTRDKVAEDVLLPENRLSILRRMEAGLFWGAWLDLPCHTNSPARRGRGIPGQQPGYPRALRSKDHPMGIEGLTEGEKIDVELSNALGTFAKDLLRARKAFLARRGSTPTPGNFQIPVGLENPWRSWIMLHDDLKDEIAEASKRGLTDMCAFGAVSRKRTDLVLWGSTGVCGEVSLFRLCSSRGGFCDFSKKKHDELEGKAGKFFETAGSAAYPPAFCKAVVEVFAASASSGL